MSSFSISDFVAYATILVSGYLLIVGILGLIKWKAYGKELYFSASCICFSIALLTQSYELALLSESAVLLLWTFFYLFIFNSLLPRDSGLNRYSSFLLPSIWLVVSLVYPTQLYIHFQTIYFIHFALLALSSVHKTYRVNGTRLLPDQHVTNYLRWLHYGLLCLIGVRLALPLLITNIEVYIAVFHGVLAIYLIGISAFQQGTIKTNITLHVEETTNLEELTKRKLEAVLKRDKAFLIPDLTINELATMMQMKASDLSTFFNSKLGMNFNDVVNKYRINEVKRLIADPTTDPKATIMELAYKSGFNSKATFNRIFKQLTGNTPKEYRKTHG